MSSSSSSGWVSGSPNRALNSTTRTPRLGEREPGVQQPDERACPAGPARRRSAGAPRVGTSSTRPAGAQWQRRVGAHAAGVRALVAVAQPLEVLRRQQRQHRRAVADREQRHLRAVEVLLDHHPLARRRRGRAPPSRSSVTTTPLPAASPSSFTTYGGPNASSAAVDLARRCRTRRAIAVGMSAAAMTSLANALEPSIARPPRAGPKTAKPLARERRRRPRRPAGPPARRRPGRAEPLRPGGDRGTVERVDRRAGSATRRDARVARARRAPRSTSGSRRQRPRARACSRPAAADSRRRSFIERLHGHRRSPSSQSRSWTTTVSSRPGPTPTAEIRAPDISSTAAT